MTTPTSAVRGRVDRSFDAVTAVLADLAATARPGTGGALSVSVRGDVVVEAHYGESRPGRPWAEDQLAVVFSAGKGPVAGLVARLMQDGRLDLDRPVAVYWPEFGAAGKQDVTVGELLAHCAGLPYWDDYVDTVTAESPTSVWADPDGIAAALAAAPQVLPTGTFAYHGQTIGWLLHGLVRAITGQSFGDAFATLVGVPLDLDVHYGLAPRHHDRVALLAPFRPSPDGGSSLTKGRDHPHTPIGKLLLASERGVDYIDIVDRLNTPEFWQVEQCAANAVCSAKGLRTFYGELVRGLAGVGALGLAPDVVATIVRPRVAATDAISGEYQRRGLCVRVGAAPWAASYTAVGHEGAGGSFAYADPSADLAVAFVTTDLHTGNDQRCARIDEAVRAGLG